MPAGRGSSTWPASFIFEPLRFLLLAACALAVAGPHPDARPRDRTNAVRLLLLPIPRGVALSRAAVGALRRSLDAACRWRSCSACRSAWRRRRDGRRDRVWPRRGLLLIVDAGRYLARCATSALHLFVRDRRRGELLALFVVVVLPMIGMLPALMGGAPEAHGRSSRAEPSAGLHASAIERRVFAAVPVRALRHGLFTDCATDAATRAHRPRHSRRSPALARSLASAWRSRPSFLHVLDSTGDRPVQRRSAPMRPPRTLAAPRLLSTGTSAVAINQLRLGAAHAARTRDAALAARGASCMFA